jgi:hypothetical protein
VRFLPNSCGASAPHIFPKDAAAMIHRDSLDKIIGTYFAAVCAAPFEYKGTVYKPHPLRVSPLIFRGFTCPAKCGGCCPRFSLDYLPSELKPDGAQLSERFVTVNGKRFAVHSDLQRDHSDYYCRNLLMRSGRCGVHGRQPFSCDFELIRFMESNFEDKPNVMSQKLFGRGWNMLRIDGERGALCEMTPPDAFTTSEVIRKLKRLRQWCEHFEIEHRLVQIITWAKSGPHNEPLEMSWSKERARSAFASHASL